MKFLFVLALLPNLLVANTLDDDPLACVDPVIAAAFLSNYGTTGAPVITKDIPSNFSGMQIPEGFEYLGSSVTKQTTIVAFRSDTAIAEAEATAAKLLEDLGWSMVVSPAYTGAGFQARKAPKVLSFCHADHGTVSVVSRAFGPDSIINILSHSYRGQRQSCDQSDQLGMRYALMDHSILPKLDLPDGAELSVSGGAHMSSSGGDATTRVGISVSMAPGELLVFFGNQIESQDWVFDASWEGELATGSVWSKASEKSRFVGILTIISAEKNNYDVSFAARRLDQ